MAVVLNEDRCPGCGTFVKAGSEACPKCGATWEVRK